MIAGRYAAFTSFRRDGSPKSTPVWIAPISGGRAGFTTEGDSYKVKRIGRNPEVTLRACNVRGTVVEGSPVIHGRAEFVSGPAAAEVEQAIKAKYGWQYRLISLGDTVRSFFTRRPIPPAAVIVHFAEADPGDGDQPAGGPAADPKGGPE
jgi:PPOX class probable F420-dependent enzyme